MCTATRTDSLLSMDFTSAVDILKRMSESSSQAHATFSSVDDHADINMATTIEFNHIRSTLPTVQPFKLMYAVPAWLASTLDDVFKFVYINFMYSPLCQIEPDWKKRVINIFKLWEDAGRQINKKEFALQFHKECRELQLPYATYNLENAYQAANHEWCIELMMSMVDVFLKHSNRSIDYRIDIVFWDIARQQMVVDCTICKHFDKVQDTASVKRSSSCDDHMPQAKRKRTVIKAYDEMGQSGKRHRSMDDLFKVDYLLSVFSVLSQVEPDWRKQVNNMADIWDEGVRLIDHKLLHSLFESECQELSLPFETFDYERAYKLAATEWRIELMLAVVEKIIKWFDDDVSLEATELAVWDVFKQQIVVDRSVCKKC